MANLASIDWTRLLDGPAIPLMFFFTAITVVCIVSVVAVQWRRVRVAETDATIKARMIEKGYSPEEIERVLQAASERTRHRTHRKRHEVAPQECCT